jgi:hypothetical protein
MLWVSLRVDDSILYRLAGERGTNVQELGLTPTSFTVGSAATFFVTGCALSVVLGLAAARRRSTPRTGRRVPVDADR